jgi:hypothetical protein
MSVVNCPFGCFTREVTVIDKACWYTEDTKVARARTPNAIERKKNKISDPSPLVVDLPDVGKSIGK